MRGDEEVRLKLFRGAWYAVWRDRGETKRRALRTTNRQAAERALIDFRRGFAGPRETVGEIYEAFLRDRAGRAGLARAQEVWVNLRPHFGHLRPGDVTRGSCRAYSAMRMRRVKPGTVIKELSTLRTALRWHDRNTPAIIEMPPAPPPRDRYLTREEYRRLREAAAATPHCQLFIVVAYTTAGRRSAILELRWDQVDFARELVRLATGDHGNKGRATVPMNSTLREALLRAKEAAISDFVIEYGGRPVRSIRHAFASACKRAGIADATPHILRHSAAVHMAEAGIRMSEISQFLGHTNTEITERVYARYSPDYLRRAARALE